MAQQLYFRVAVIALFVAPHSAMACSYWGGYVRVEPPQPSFLGRETTEDIPPPKIRLERFERGQYSSEVGSCDESGEITLVIEGMTEPDGENYEVSVAEGEHPIYIFPREMISPIRLNRGKIGFSFYWVDSGDNNRYQQDIDMVIEIRKIGRYGKKGLPARVKISSPGRFI